MRGVYGVFAAFIAWLIALSVEAATFHPISVGDLIADINTANSNNEDDVINLGKQTFTLTAINNSDNNEGFNGLPSILSDNSHQLIIKHGIIERDPTATGFRLIRVALGANLILKKVTLRNGLASSAGPGDFPGNAGGAILNGGHLSIKKSELTNNAASSAVIVGGSGGGAIYNLGGTIDIIKKTTFSSNSSARNFGGAIHNNFDITGTVQGVITNIEETTFSDNTAGGDGGAIANFSSIITIADSTFSNNTAESGGAIFNAPNGTIDTIINSTFSGNHAIGGNDGVAVAQDGGGGDGGAISNDDTINQIFNTTIANNTALSRGGGIFNFAATIGDLDSDIIAQNTACFGPDIANVASLIQAASFNLIGTDQGHNIVNGVNNNQVGTLLDPLNPLLGPLQNNGGPTFTMALLPGSPAIDKGNNPDNLEFDQRGPSFFRTVGPATDVGAYEVQAVKHRNRGRSSSGGINPGFGLRYPVPIDRGFFPPDFIAPPIGIPGPGIAPAIVPDVNGTQSIAGVDVEPVAGVDVEPVNDEPSREDHAARKGVARENDASGCSNTNGHTLVLLWLIVPLLLKRRRVEHT